MEVSQRVNYQPARSTRVDPPMSRAARPSFDDTPLSLASTMSPQGRFGDGPASGVDGPASGVVLGGSPGGTREARAAVVKGYEERCEVLQGKLQDAILARQTGDREYAEAVAEMEQAHAREVASVRLDATRDVTRGRAYLESVTRGRASLERGLFQARTDLESVECTLAEALLARQTGESEYAEAAAEMAQAHAREVASVRADADRDVTRGRASLEQGLQQARSELESVAGSLADALLARQTGDREYAEAAAEMAQAHAREVEKMRADAMDVTRGRAEREQDLQEARTDLENVAGKLTLSHAQSAHALEEWAEREQRLRLSVARANACNARRQLAIDDICRWMDGVLPAR